MHVDVGGTAYPRITCQAVLGQQPHEAGLISGEDEHQHRVERTSVWEVPAKLQQEAVGKPIWVGLHCDEGQRHSWLAAGDEGVLGVDRRLRKFEAICSTTHEITSLGLASVLVGPLALSYSLHAPQPAQECARCQHC